MNIIIAGGGAVATHLAILFSREKHNIRLIDTNREHNEDLNSAHDFLAVTADPLSIQTLRDANIEDADLFIAVTPYETNNLVACVLAKQFGARKTIARVNNYEYIAPKNQMLFKSAGIDQLIYPEEMAGQEIASNICRSWTRQWIPMQKGSLILLSVKLRADSGTELLDKPLREVSKPESPYHIVAVKRKDETIIPHGNDCLHDQDVVYFMTTERETNKLKDICGKIDYPDVENVIFLGGGAITERALVALPDYMHAKVFESDMKRIEHLQDVIPNKKILYLNADGRNLDNLAEENINHIQGFVATTESSATNVLACLNAKKLGVRKTIAMIDNSNYVTMAQSLDIGSIIDKKILAAGKIYQSILSQDVQNVKSLVVANADVCEFTVDANSEVTKKMVKDLGLPSTVALGGLVRDKQSFLINGDTQLQAGDMVVAICLENGLKKLEKYFRK